MKYAKRCGAKVKHSLGWGLPKRRAGPLCRAWAMPNGRCRWHGGKSTGPKTAEGQARINAARIPGRARWVARMKAAGRKLPSGRKAGAAWITERMRERARAEAQRLGGWSGLAMDRKLVAVLLESSKGDEKARERAKVMMRELELETAKSFLREMIGRS
jgi:hypothetical protein